jgi:DNA-binding CsgD family transcriptional regulator
LVERPAAAAWFVRRALAVGDRRRAEAVVDCARQLALQNQEFPTALAAAMHAGALIDRDAEALEQTAMAHRRPWDRASAFEDAGVVLAEMGARDAAARAFEQAVGSYEDAGARPEVARVRRRVNRLHAGRRPPRRAGRPLWGWESLTEAEHRVAALVSEGLTNPQVAKRLFLSRHTVDFHLRQTFRKLDVTSRVELTRVVLAHQHDR